MFAWACTSHETSLSAHTPITHPTLQPKQGGVYKSAAGGEEEEEVGGLETSCHFQPITQAPTLQLDFAAPVSCPTAKGCAVETKT